MALPHIEHGPLLQPANRRLVLAAQRARLAEVFDILPTSL